MFDWLGGAATVDDLIAKGSYRKAEKRLREEFRGGRREPELRLRLAEVLVLDGRGKDAVPIFIGVADELARAGQGGRAIGVLKKIEHVQPGRADVARRLAALISDQGQGAAEVPPIAAEPEVGLGFGLGPPAEPSSAADSPPPAESTSAAPPAPSPLFGDFAQGDLLAVMEKLRLSSFRPGDIVVGEGQAGGSLYYITLGRVKAFVRTPKGGYQMVREMGEGDFFGEISLIRGGARTATVTAAAPCELLELDRDTVDGLAAARPQIRAVLERFADERAGR